MPLGPQNINRHPSNELKEKTIWTNFVKILVSGIENEVKPTFRCHLSPKLDYHWFKSCCLCTSLNIQLKIFQVEKILKWNHFRIPAAYQIFKVQILSTEKATTVTTMTTTLMMTTTMTTASCMLMSTTFFVCGCNFPLQVQLMMITFCNSFIACKISQSRNCCAMSS